MEKLLKATLGVELIHRIMTTDQNWSGYEERELQRLAVLYQEIRRLYAWLGLLTGLSFLSISLLGGLAIWLNMQQNHLQKQLPNLASRAEFDRMKALESRINSLESQSSLMNQNVGYLNQQVSKGLPNQIKGIQSNVNELQISAYQFCKNIK